MIGLLVSGLVGWALCGVAMGIARKFLPLRKSLVVHAVAAPILFAMVAYVYFHWFRDTTPLQTAIAFVVIVGAMDFLVVATFIEKSYAMFKSLLGTWIPFALIFGATYIVGRFRS